jgi:H+-transporting ATPase
MSHSHSTKDLDPSVEPSRNSKPSLVVTSPKDPNDHSSEAVGAPTLMEKEMERQREIAKGADHKKGLTAAQATSGLAQWGKNELPEKVRNPILMFLSYFWGPMPGMIWVAIIVELVKGITIGEGWEDFGVLMLLQIANAVIGFTEEFNAGNAIAALKSALKPQCYVCRDGQWTTQPAWVLVPGDLIKLKIGDVIPADSILIEAATVEVDQAALTGESLPVTVHQGGHLKMGSALKRGEGDAIVTATGSKTFLGTAAALIASVESQGNLQKVILTITASLLIVSVVLCIIIGIFLGVLPVDERLIIESTNKSLGVVSVVIVILVASIPIAIEIVCTSTLAVGSHMLAEKKVIVARLTAIEELAGMTVLCSDKTGTLTLNQLALKEPILLDPKVTVDELFFLSSLCSRRDKTIQDAIDKCMCDSIPLEKQHEWDDYDEIHFEPFNPVDKKVVVELKHKKTGELLQICKGAPHIILRLAHNKMDIVDRVMGSVQELADRGFRSLGVAVNRSQESDKPKWDYLGIVSLFDPPRPDTKQTIADAVKYGIEVKMITGDHTAIAKETCRDLGMGTAILNTAHLDVDDADPAALSRVDAAIMTSSGFAEVMPEHKFMIVDRIRKMGHITGMTGDGVNDAPALKRADVGIAVFPCTDAAKAAADLVLTEPGLAVVIFAILESRKIFQRMRNYIIYRIACTVQLLCFFFFAILCVDPSRPYMYGDSSDANFGCTITPACLAKVEHHATLQEMCCQGDMAHANAFTLPVISLVIITILNDGCMITISHDHVEAEPRPQSWSLMEMSWIASIIGFVACFSSLILVAFGMHANAQYSGDFFGIIFGAEGRSYITWHELRTLIYLKVSISDFLTLFSARTRTWFFQRKIGALLGGAACIAMGTSTILSLYWDKIFDGLGPSAHMAGLRFSNSSCVAVWIYCILWFFVQDACKVAAYSYWDSKVAYVPTTHTVDSTTPQKVDKADPLPMTIID